MTCTLTAVAAAIWVTPLAGIRAGYFISLYPFPRSPGLTGGERAAGVGIAMYLGGFFAGVVALSVAFLWTRSYVGDDYLKQAQTANAIAIAGLVIWAVAAYLGSARHAPPEYAGQRATLDVEIRAPKSLLDGVPFSQQLLGAGYTISRLRATRAIRWSCPTNGTCSAYTIGRSRCTAPVNKTAKWRTTSSWSCLRHQRAQCRGQIALLLSGATNGPRTESG